MKNPQKKRSNAVWVISRTGVGYCVFNPATREVILNATSGNPPRAVTLEEAKQFCSDKKLTFLVADPIYKTLGDLINAPKHPKELPSFTPFELANIASQFAIAAGERGRDQEPKSYLNAAYDLLLESAAFIEGVQKWTSYTFDQILRQVPGSPQPEPGGKTPFRGIITKDGLIKAIRREFDYVEAELIITRGSMNQGQLERLRSRVTERRSNTARISRKPGPNSTRKKPKTA